MAKYSFEFKKQLVSEYLSGRIGGDSLARKYGINRSQLWLWINAYKKFGDEGLKRSQKKEKYTARSRIKKTPASIEVGIGVFSSIPYVFLDHNAIVRAGLSRYC